MQRETPPPDAGGGVIDVDRPASFAGMNRIRFGGSVAGCHTLSAPALPGGVFSWVPPYHGGDTPLLRDVGPEPGDHVLDELGALGFVVEFVAETREGAALDARRSRQHF
jgi:hypothetical protein